MIQSKDQFIENLWRWKSGVPEKDFQNTPPTLKEIFSSNWSEQFEKYMRNRLAMGYFRYGPLKDQKMGEYDCIDSIRKRLKLYDETGNDEVLVDCANLCMIEYIKGTHPKKHFEAIDDGIHAEKKPTKKPITKGTT